jgi:hypothetical protein
MRELTILESRILNALSLCGLDHALITVSSNALKKGFTDATVPLREFLRRQSIHNFDAQANGKHSIAYYPIMALGRDGWVDGEISFQRPATKGGRMCRISKIGGIKTILELEPNDVLLCFVRNGILHFMNLTRFGTFEQGIDLQERSHGATIINAAKQRVLFVMRCMPECSAAGKGARCSEIAELSGLILETRKSALVLPLLNELVNEGQVNVPPKQKNTFRLCH